VNAAHRTRRRRLTDEERAGIEARICGMVS